MNLFIDTNIYLNFYHLTSDDLEELRKLAVLVDEKKIALYVTDQVKDEFRRNRESKIADALKRLREQRLNLQFPQMCKDYPEYGKLREEQRNYENDHTALIQKLIADVGSNNLKADKIIAELFAKASLLKTDSGVIAQAWQRMQIGNPPGKDGSLGDAISWHLLLQHLPEGQDVYLVTDDTDFVSVLDENRIKEFLIREWTGAKKSNVICYRRLSLFFKDKFPQIKLATELMKELLIQRLAASPNFISTHATIAKLSDFAEFTDDQVNAVVHAALSNNQVGWIISDTDVESFYSSLLETRGNQMNPELRAELEKLLEPPANEEIDLDEIPF